MHFLGQFHQFLVDHGFAGPERVRPARRRRGRSEATHRPRCDRPDAQVRRRPGPVRFARRCRSRSVTGWPPTSAGQDRGRCRDRRHVRSRAAVGPAVPRRPRARQDQLSCASSTRCASCFYEYGRRLVEQRRDRRRRAGLHGHRPGARRSCARSPSRSRISIAARWAQYRRLFELRAGVRRQRPRPRRSTR